MYCGRKIIFTVRRPPVCPGLHVKINLRHIFDGVERRGVRWTKLAVSPRANSCSLSSDCAYTSKTIKNSGLWVFVFDVVSA